MIATPPLPTVNTVAPTVMLTGAVVTIDAPAAFSVSTLLPTVNVAEVAAAIDEIPVLCLAAAAAAGTTRIRGAGELRHKESDRIAGIADGLRALGARVRVEGDDITVYDEGGHDAGQALHIALHDPQDVIADCEAKLATLDEHTPDYLSMYGSPGPPQCKTCITDRSGYEEHWEGDPWPCLTLRLLARTYRHREGYADHWGVLAAKEGA